jgi:hypothetical protein
MATEDPPEGSTFDGLTGGATSPILGGGLSDSRRLAEFGQPGKAGFQQLRVAAHIRNQHTARCGSLKSLRGPGCPES